MKKLKITGNETSKLNLTLFRLHPSFQYLKAIVLFELCVDIESRSYFCPRPFSGVGQNDNFQKKTGNMTPLINFSIYGCKFAQKIEFVVNHHK